MLLVRSLGRTYSYIPAALRNGVAAVDDAAAVQRVCDSFDEAVIWALAAKWTGLLPCPFTADDAAAGYR
jgi:hypothetical protein